ncbi:DUF6279 family lipoprotein [Marinibactrum halimedae]|uniref:Lipoprotein n=1 Tax=Marinibactrum halimedae TaxID=1444977 RepID=A0AA37T2D5_9GAMM|nr:DUF6279 family lipoprotein [Marinibactrum halimedae]MCD9457405.1 DUF6279 family lipoprotein [Marinibactrum halimedae]GLS25544.1 hypothetical protein GCM10007877_12580 [Marinibactrum halimedae]
MKYTDIPTYCPKNILPYRQLCKVFVIAALCMALFSCSSTKIGYRFLDNWLRWQLDDYVDLNRTQEQQVIRFTKEFHSWHQTTQLPVYVDFINQQITIIEKPSLTPEDIQQSLDGSYELWLASALELLPKGMAVLKTLDESQLAQTIEALKENEAEFEEEMVSKPLAEQHAYRQEKMTDSLQKWLGKLTDHQHNLIAEWVDKMRYERERILQQQIQWRTDFAEAMAMNRNSGEFKERIRTLFVTPDELWGEEYERYIQDNQQQTLLLLSGIHQSLSDKQRKKLIKRLVAYRDDFEDLSDDI